MEAADIQNELKATKRQEDELIENLTIKFKNKDFKNANERDESINELLMQTSFR